MRLLDMTGKTFGRLTVIDRDGTRLRGYWNCKCLCGKTSVVSGSSLRKGTTVSCGCYHREICTKHGEFSGGSKKATPEYLAWTQMLDRCRNENHPHFHHYGGRGIKVCEQWQSFMNFLKDMGRRPSAQHELDRFPNNNGDYAPGNCRWATRTQQCRNTRVNRMITLDGVTLCLTEWAERQNLKIGTIYRRLRLGWSIEKALLTACTRPSKSLTFYQ